MSDIKQLHKIIDEIIESRKTAKAKIDEHILGEEASHEVLKEFHKPVVEQLISMDESRKKTVENLSKAVESFATPAEPLSYDFDKPLSYDIDKQLQDQILNQYKLKMPGDLLQSIDPLPNVREMIQSTILQLQKLGGAKSSEGRKHGKSTEKYEILSNHITALRDYLQVLKVMASSLESQEGTGLYKDFDELCERLSLLISSKQAGNTSHEVRNEIMEIIDILLKNNIVNNREHKILFTKYLQG